MHFILAAEEGGGGAGGMIAALVFLAIEFGIIILTIAGVWKAFVKAGEPGWASIVPIYNTIVMLKIAGKPLWWFILLFIPCVGLIVALVVIFSLAKAYGKGAGYALGLIFLPFIFWPLLGFGDAQYVGA